MDKSSDKSVSVKITLYSLSIFLMTDILIAPKMNLICRKNICYLEIENDPAVLRR